MTTLALDLGTKTGFAWGAGKVLQSGTVNFANGKYDGAGMRFLKFRRFLDGFRPERVAYEAVRRHIGTDAAHIYGGLMATLTAWCEEHKVPYEGVPVQTIKKFATGAGNAGKEDVIAAVREWGFKPKDDNEADAIALWKFVEVRP
jgi:Holliday junction resolvasome RuvABC endonuclease subunit